MGWGRFHFKNQSSKISCYCPFKWTVAQDLLASVFFMDLRYISAVDLETMLFLCIPIKNPKSRETVSLSLIKQGLDSE
jgi:hypothetical protein